MGQNGTVREALNRYRDGGLHSTSTPNVADHHGMGGSAESTGASGGSTSGGMGSRGDEVNQLRDQVGQLQEQVKALESKLVKSEK